MAMEGKNMMATCLATVYSTRTPPTTEPTETCRTVSARPETGRVIGHTTLSLVFRLFGLYFTSGLGLSA